MIKINEIQKFTESDVEMKLIYPLLTTNKPEGLGFSDYHIPTKPKHKKVINR